MATQPHPDERRSRTAAALGAALCVLPLIVLAVLLAEPARAERSISGGLDGMVVVSLGALAFALVWRRARGVACLDVLAALAVLVAYALFERNLLVFLMPMVAALGWYAWRGASRAVRAARPVPLPTAPLGVRPATVLVIVLALAHVALALDGRFADVGEASMQGALALLDGRSPYQDPATRALLGDTYGPLAYLLYLPAVALLPAAAAAQAMALAGQVLVAAAVWVAARRLTDRDGAMVALATWLAFPASAYTLSVAAHDDLVAGLVVLALVARRPLVAGLLVGAAAAAKLFPALLVLVLLRRHGTPRAQLALLGGAAAALAIAVAPIAIASSGAWVSDVLHATVINQGSRMGAHVWGVPLGEWRLDLPYNFWTLWEDQLPRVHTLAKLAVVAAVAWLATRVPAAQRDGDGRALRPDGGLRAALAAALATVALLMLVLNNLSWNYVSWFAPLVVLVLFTPAAAPPRDEGA